MAGRIPVGRVDPSLLDRLDNYGLLNEFLAALAAGGASSDTLKAYYSAIKDFLEFIGDKRLREVTIADINKWRLHRLRHGFPRKKTRNPRSWMTTLHYYTLFLKRFLKWLGLEVDVPVTKKPPRQIDALREEEVEKLLEAADNLLDQLILHILLDTGIRSRELLGIRVGDIDIENREITVRETKYGYTRKVVVTRETIELIKTWIKTRRLEPKDKLVPLTYSGLYKRLKRLARKAGIDPHRVRPHILRHTFATKALRKGINVFTLQKILGHKDIKTTQVYTHLTIEDIHREYEEKIENSIDNQGDTIISYCPRCGRKWVAGAIYCPYCGFNSKTIAIEAQ